MCDRIELSAEARSLLPTLSERRIFVTAPVLNALVNPFSSGDFITLPPGYATNLCGSDRGFQSVTEKVEKVEILAVSHARVLNYHNNKRGLFLPTIQFRLNDKDCEGDVTVDLLRLNNLDADIEFFA